MALAAASAAYQRENIKAVTMAINRGGESGGGWRRMAYRAAANQRRRHGASAALEAKKRTFNMV